MRVAVKIELSEADRKQLERWSRSRSVAVRLRERSRMVLVRLTTQKGPAGIARLAASTRPESLVVQPRSQLFVPLPPAESRGDHGGSGPDPRLQLRVYDHRAGPIPPPVPRKLRLDATLDFLAG